MADSQRKTANLFDPNATRYHMGKGANNRIGSVSNGAMFYIEASHNAQYSIKVYTEDDTFVRLYLSNAPIVENVGETYNVISESETTTNPTVTITNTNYNYLWIQVGGSWYTEHGGASIMLNVGNTALPLEPYGWVHSLRKLTTAIEDIENPLYTDGTAITSYTIKGNTVQDGTPTPSSPISVNGVGNKTANLFDFNSWFAQLNPTRCTVSKNGYSITVTATGTDGYTGNSGFQIPVESSTTYTFYYESDVNINGAGYIFENGVADADHWHTFNNNNRQPVIFTTRADTTYIILRLGVGTSGNSITYSDLMLNSGSTAKPYEPYGYKIPISSAGVTTNLYTAEPLMKIGDTVDSLVSTGTATYNIKKLVFNGTENWKKSNNGYFYVENAPADYSNQTLGIVNSMWTHFVAVANSGNGSNLNNGEACFYGTQTPTVPYKETYIKYNAASTADDFKAFLAQEYANGTPVTVYYILATPTTETVTAPSIPTTDGANSITVDTTVQPSEFSATWTGWHDAYVKEKSENIYDKYNVIQVANLGTRYGSYVDKGIYSIYNDTDNDVYWGGNGFQSRYLACSPHSTATIDMSTFSYSDYGFIMPYNDASLGDVSIVQGSTVPDHYIPYWK